MGRYQFYDIQANQIVLLVDPGEILDKLIITKCILTLKINPDEIIWLRFNKILITVTHPAVSLSDSFCFL